MDPTRIVVLASGGGSNLAAMLAAHSSGQWGGRVVAVGSDVPDCGALDLAAEAEVPTFALAPRDFPHRSEWDVALADQVDRFEPDLVVCAGFMRILGDEFLSRWDGRAVNTHPALLPSFPGAHGVRDALAYGVKLTGVTVHLVDGGVDTGPIIAQRAVPVRDDDDESSLHERIKSVERRLIVDVVGTMARSGWQVEDRRVLLNDPLPLD